MSQEGQLLDKKSLRFVIGKSAEWNELVKDCIAFANATGGHLLLGIEDGQEMPSAGQRIPPELPDTIRRKTGDIHERIGLEIPRSRIRRGIDQLVKAGKPMAEGVKSGTRYRLP